MNIYDDDDVYDADDEIEGVDTNEPEYGVCPICSRPGDMLNVGKDHWMVCHEHQVKWRIGVGFFTPIHGGKPEKWDQAAEFLKRYREVQPATDEAKNPAAQDEVERFRRLLGD